MSNEWNESRRSLMATGATAFAAAALPVQAQSLIRTPDRGLVAGEVDVGGVPAYSPSSNAHYEALDGVP